VVPAEMPKGWLPAAYEAQAVVARSYALARLGGRGRFDLYADTRDQVYGGIAAERASTNEAVGDTSGRVLTHAGRPILAYYSSSTGGRTDSGQPAFPGRAAAPYLVSVADPYDTLSPLHRWRVPVDLGPLERTYGFSVLDLRVHPDAADYAATVTLIGAHQSKTINGRQFSRALGLRSRRFSIAAVSLDPPPLRVAYQQPLTLHGFIRGLSGVSLQQQTASESWRLIAKLHSDANGRFNLTVHARTNTAYRLAAQQLAGPPAAVQVRPQLKLKTDGDILTGTVNPALPLQIERNTNGHWQPQTHLTVGPSGFFRKKLDHGRYRISTTPSRHLASTTSAPVTINR
jgi:SpoIID/LytB domain protein